MSSDAPKPFIPTTAREAVLSALLREGYYLSEMCRRVIEIPETTTLRQDEVCARLAHWQRIVAEILAEG